jgi:hypothetical protein
LSWTLPGDWQTDPEPLDVQFCDGAVADAGAAAAIGAAPTAAATAAAPTNGAMYVSVFRMM